MGLIAVLLCVGLGWQAQAAHATYGKVTVVKINEGGNATDAFTFSRQVMPSGSNFSIKGGEAKTFSVECNVDRPGHSGECERWGYPSLSVTELASPGYKLTGIVCRSTQGTTAYASEPTASSPVDVDSTVDVGARRMTLKVSWYEWVKCYVTNTRLQPAIAIDKTGPATAVAGQLVAYHLEVTNPGEVAFAEDKVEVTDALCQAAPVLDSKNGDASPDALNPGDSWSYSCSVQTVVGQTRVDNIAKVNATDACDRQVSDEDDAVTELAVPPLTPTPRPPTPDSPPVQIAATVQSPPAVATPATARLRGPSGCSTRRTVTASVTGKSIVKVTFYLDGKRVRTVARPDGHGRWQLPVQLSRLRFGGHEVRALVRFAPSSATSRRTLRLNVSRCRVAIARPQFAG